MENPMKKLTHLMLLTGLVGMPLVAAAEDSPHTITGNLSFVSDYQYRGISQTDEDPAIQGGFDYAHKSGFYLGTWGSNVEFGTANMEWDVYGGYAGSVGDLGYNVGVLAYIYPDYDDANTTEVYGGVTYKGFGLKASYTVSSEYFDLDNGDGTVYWDASYAYTFENGLGLGLHYGYTAGSGDQIDYADWKVGVTYPIGKFTVGLAYTDTDLSKADCGGTDLCDSRVILSVGTTF
jgi:uncharacterized protein (TIGR02001 family)